MKKRQHIITTALSAFFITVMAAQAWHLELTNIDGTLSGSGVYQMEVYYHADAPDEILNSVFFNVAYDTNKLQYVSVEYNRWLDETDSGVVWDRVGFGLQSERIYGAGVIDSISASEPLTWTQRGLYTPGGTARDSTTSQLATPANKIATITFTQKEAGTFSNLASFWLAPPEPNGTIKALSGVKKDGPWVQYATPNNPSGSSHPDCKFYTDPGVEGPPTPDGFLMVRKTGSSSILTVATESALEAWRAASLQLDFDNLTPVTGDYWNGSDLSGGFNANGVHFLNVYNSDWQNWAGFAYSRVNDTTTAGYENQYAVISGTGVSGVGTYVIAYDDGPWSESAIITLPSPACVSGFYVNNTTYAALSMQYGDDFAKQFGGPTGSDPDWFLLTVTAKDRGGAVIGSVEHYLADFRSANPDEDYIQTEWEWLDLTTLGDEVKTLHFSLSSSDTGAWGINTPTYFAMDGLCIDPTSAAASDAADWNNDGIPNLIAYAIGRSMGETVDTPLMTPSMTDGCFEIEFQRRLNMTDVTLHAEICTDLRTGNWCNDAASVREWVVASDAEVETVRAQSLLKTPQGFMRLKATVAP